MILIKMSDSSDEEHPFVKYGTALPDIDGEIALYVTQLRVYLLPDVIKTWKMVFGFTGK